MIKRFAAVLACATALGAAPIAGPASALPVAHVDDASGQVIQVYGGCGPYGHRGPYGGCRTGGQWGGYIPGRSCPWGWHIGPYGRHCWRNW